MEQKNLSSENNRLSDYWQNVISFLKSETFIGGISISNAAIRFIKFNDGIFEKIGVVLEPGVIVDGNLKNREFFLKALLTLRYKLGNPKEDIHVVVSLPPNHVFTQSFSLPTIENRLINEAANLNLQLLSPIDIKTAYTDWEKIGEIQEDGGKIELLGAFVSKTVVNEYVAVFREAGFGIVAAEFPALSLARLIKEDSYNAGVGKPQVILSVSSDGPEFIVIKNNRLYFNYFVPWSSIEGRQISLSMFSDILTQEMKKILNFYSSHWNSQISDLILITHGLYEEIEQIIKQNFPEINTKPLILNEKFSSLNPAWYASLGSAIRGRMSRSSDVFISLMDVGTEQSFFESRVTFFVKTWRIIILSTLSVLVLFFFMENLFFLQISKNLDSQIAAIVQKQESQEVTDLESKATDFNMLIDEALVAKSNSKQISRFFDIFANAAGSEVKIQRVLFDADRATTLITAVANNNQAVINFKNNLSAQTKDFKNVDFSFTSTTNNPDGTISFPITLTLNI
jgi:Tfp pilus assembly PilM family ATPase